MDTECANLYNETDNSSQEIELPDWRFLQRPYSETELQEEEASSSRVRKRPLKNNQFVLSEASEERPSKNSAKKTKTTNIKFRNIFFQMIFTVRPF